MGLPHNSEGLKRGEKLKIRTLCGGSTMGKLGSALQPWGQDSVSCQGPLKTLLEPLGKAHGVQGAPKSPWTLSVL